MELTTKELTTAYLALNQRLSWIEHQPDSDEYGDLTTWKAVSGAEVKALAAKCHAAYQTATIEERLEQQAHIVSAAYRAMAEAGQQAVSEAMAAYRDLQAQIAEEVAPA